MSKFKVRFKVEKLELEVEGERASVPDVTNAIQKHLSNLLSAPAALAGGSGVQDLRERTADIVEVSSTRKSRRRSQTKSTPAGSSNGDSVVDFKHDPAKWGNPQQIWTTAQKSIWLLFVAKNECGIKELSAPSIASVFNKHFRQSGAIIKNNVSRDLGKCKAKAPPWVGEDAAKEPGLWYLTDEGDKIARKLVAEATGAEVVN